MRHDIQQTFTKKSSGIGYVTLIWRVGHCWWRLLQRCLIEWIHGCFINWLVYGCKDKWIVWCMYHCRDHTHTHTHTRSIGKRSGTHPPIFQRDPYFTFNQWDNPYLERGPEDLEPDIALYFWPVQNWRTQENEYRKHACKITFSAEEWSCSWHSLLFSDRYSYSAMFQSDIGLVSNISIKM